MAEAVSEIKFLIDFEQMGDEFSEALKKAMKKADFKGGEVPKDLQRDIQQIKEDLFFRIGGDLGGSRMKFLREARAESQKLQKEEFRKSMTQTLMMSKYGEKWGLKSDEEARKFIDEFLNKYLEKLQKAMKSPQMFRKLQGELSETLGDIRSLMSGTTPSNIVRGIRRTMDEVQREKLFKRFVLPKLKESGIEGITEKQKQATELKIGARLGKGEKIITSRDELEAEFLKFMKENLDVSDKERANLLNKLISGSKEGGEKFKGDFWKKWWKNYSLKRKQDGPKVSPFRGMVWNYLKQIGGSKLEELVGENKPLTGTGTGSRLDFYAAVSTDVWDKVVKPILDDMGTDPNFIEKFENKLKEGGGVALLKGMAKLIGSEEDIQKRKEEMGEVFPFGLGGKGFGKISEVVQHVVDLMSKEESQEEVSKQTLQGIKMMVEAIKGMESTLSQMDISEKTKEQIEQLTQKLDNSITGEM